MGTVPIFLISEDRGAVRVLTMNRPEKRNALNTALTQALLDALRAADADEAIAWGNYSSKTARILFDREVEERILAPISVFGVALERIVAGALHAAVAGLLALPAMMFLMHETAGIEVHPSWPVLLPLTAICGLVSGAMGLTLGTNVQPRFAGLLFAVVIRPMMLFGCAYYPYAGLAALGPVRYLFLLNPLTFMSEAMRLGATPEVPHMSLPLLFAGLVGFLGLFVFLGARSFEKRTIL